jgi:hypothetical protein
LTRAEHTLQQLSYTLSGGTSGFIINGAQLRRRSG